MVLDNWSNKTIGELCNFSNGYGFRPPDWSKEGLPIIRIQNLNGSKEFNYFNGIPDDSWLVEPGTILFAWAGTRGVSFGPNIWTGPRGVLNQHIYRIHPHKEVNPLWLYVALEFATKNIEKNAHGFKATLLHVRKEEITSQVVHCPPLFEQKKIVTLLADIDALITSLDQLIAKKRDIMQATMQQLLTGKTRLPGFSGKWEVKKLGEIAKIYRGASPRPIEDPKWFNEYSNIGWVRISDVTKSNKYLFNTTQKLSEQGVKQSRFVKQENLIMSICATVGKPVITKMDVCIHDGFVIFESPKLNMEYLYYYLSSIENFWSKNGQTGSQMNLNTKIIEIEMISFPSNSKEQTVIATILSDMDAEIAALEQRRDKTRAIKQGMMQELLTGKTRLL